MTVAMRGGELVVDAAVAKLKAGLSSRISAINSEKADGIIVAIPNGEDYYVGGVTLLARAPAIIVTVGEAIHAGEGAHSLITDYELIVFVVDEDADRQALTRKLWRLSRAVTEVLWDDAPQEALIGSAYMLRPDREEPGPTERIDDDQAMFRSGRSVVFTATQSEN